MAPPTRMTWLLIGGRPRLLAVEFSTANPEEYPRNFGMKCQEIEKTVTQLGIVIIYTDYAPSSGPVVSQTSNQGSANSRFSVRSAPSGSEFTQCPSNR